MLHNLGSLGISLEELGFALVAPDGGCRMSHSQALSFADALSGAYKDKNQDAAKWFTSGRFWDSENHFDWLDSTTDEVSGDKEYGAFDASLTSTLSAAEGYEVRGIIGFSQGCVWGAITTALALRGELPFGDSLKFGIYMSGFLPEFDRPKIDLWPIERNFQSRFIMGENDPVFPNARGSIEPLAEKFPAQNREIIIAPNLGHCVTDDTPTIDSFIDLAKQYSN